MSYVPGGPTTIPMRDYRADATVSGDGSLTLRDLPFSRGEEVEVVVRARSADAPSLRGSVRAYERPFEPPSARLVMAR